MAAEERADDSHRVRVTLTFETTLGEMRRHLAGDLGDGPRGITVEGSAANLCRHHDPALGYIEFEAVDLDAPRPARQPVERVEIQLAHRIDCAKNGCEQPHSDDGQVIRWPDETRRHDIHINGHVATAVERRVTYGPWREVADPDRVVFAEDRKGAELVRYAAAGRWYLEFPRWPDEARRSLTLDQAVEEARRIHDAGGRVLLGRPGGARFDRALRGHIDGPERRG